MPHLTPVPDQPGVFLNPMGFRVDKRGVLLRFSDAQRSERELEQEILGGPADSPAKFLKLVSLDPRLPTAMRLEAAKAAAPYFDKKTPVAIEQKTEDVTLDIAAIAALPREKRKELLRTLADLGVEISVPLDSARSKE